MAIDKTPAVTGEDLYQLATQHEAIWTDPATSARVKKGIVRTLIEEVLLEVGSFQAELLLTIHWREAFLPTSAFLVADVVSAAFRHPVS